MAWTLQAVDVNFCRTRNGGEIGGSWKRRLRGIVAGGNSGKRRGQAGEGDGGERGGGRTRGLREDGTAVEMGRGSAEGGRCRKMAGNVEVETGGA